MKLKNLLLLLLASVSLCANAANTIVEVEQVTDAVALTDDVDYTITSTTPFATSGSVDIVNTEHAVLVFAKIKPSKVIASHLGQVYINGEKAVNGQNCRVQMYGVGAIVFPYGKDHKGLTVWDGQNFEGESCDNYTIGHSGGYMKTLTATNFNNMIRSFKLKRGYMVTFAVGTGGWGYSRCFIADKEDLEMKTLPAILDKRISSYRLFHWFNAQKKGLASNGSKEANDVLNTSWCYDWAAGNADRLPDQEWVPNHIYEDWPSSSAIGSVSQSCHTKNNNEPANSADDHPQTVETVLNNWENMMRTGLRLCSPATHDGGWGWHDDFMKAIDERGWRCDIVDFHGYWDGEWGSLDWRIDRYAYGRPVWFSEWVWGASWNNNGIFGQAPDGKDSFSQKNQQKCYDGTVPILERLNANSRVERYAYWNSEADASKILRGSELSKLGKYYAEMNSGFAFNPKNQFVPKETRLENPVLESCNYDRKTGKVTLTWSDANGDLMETITVQRKAQGETLYSAVGDVQAKDKSSKTGASYTYTDVVTEPGVYLYRIKAVSYNNKTFYTEESTVNVAPAQGTSEIQYGKLSVDNDKANETYFSESFDATPCVFIGTVTNKNAKFLFGNNLSKSDKNKFTYQMLPWQTNTGAVEKNEEVPFLALKPGNYKFGELDCEVGTAKSSKASGTNLWTDATEVKFAKPFPEGEVPVVLAEIKAPSYATKTALSVRVFDVTNTGFKFVVYPEDKPGQKVALAQNINYLAITSGIAYADEESGIVIAAGFDQSGVYGATTRDVPFMIKAEQGTSEEQLYLYSPVVLHALCTNQYTAACTLRRTDMTEKDENGTTWTTGAKVKRTLDHAIVVDGKTIATSTSAAEYRDFASWVAVANYREGGSKPTTTAIKDINAEGTLKAYTVDGKMHVIGATNYSIYNMSGALVPVGTPLAAGVYVVKAGAKSVKVIVK